MNQATGGGYPPKRESPHRGQVGRAFGESTINGADALHYGISPAFIQHVHKVKAVIISVSAAPQPLDHGTTGRTIGAAGLTVTFWMGVCDAIHHF